MMVDFGSLIMIMVEATVVESVGWWCWDVFGQDMPSYGGNNFMNNTCYRNVDGDIGGI